VVFWRSAVVVIIFVQNIKKAKPSISSSTVPVNRIPTVRSRKRGVLVRT
jgi:hypothetical protein